jgi:hypothetical protein
MSTRIIIIANKWWEVAPLVAVLQHANERQIEMSASSPDLSDASLSGPGVMSRNYPRLTLRCKGAFVECWCLQDLMDSSANSSLTWEKARVLPRAVRGSNDRFLVVAFGTAAHPDSSMQNGTVVIGADVFVHDPFETPPDPTKHWTHPELNRVVLSESRDILNKAPKSFINEAEKRLLVAPNAGATPPRVVVDINLVAVGVVNVTKTADYGWADTKALRAFGSIAGSAVAGSLETTHGVIRLVLNAPFLYVSGLANELGEFPLQVGSKPYSQNFVAAHNAAIALAWFLPALADALTAH